MIPTCFFVRLHLPSDFLPSITLGEFSGVYAPLKDMTQKEQEQMIQDHYLFDKPVSPLLRCSGMARDWPDARGIWYNKVKDFLVWLNEEDHVRIISMQKGGDMKTVFERFCKGLKQVWSLLHAFSLWIIFCIE